MSYNKILDRDLKQLKDSIEDMILETKVQYAEAFEVIKSGDPNSAEMILDHDKIIDNMQNEFTSTALWKIAKQQLVAKDLRLAVGGILISREIERIADYAKKITKFYVQYKPTKKYTNSIVKMFQIIIDMLDAISAIFEAYSVDNARVVYELEQSLNNEFKEVYKYLIKTLRKVETNEEAEEIGEAMKQVKNLERAGDHLLNVQEIVTFVRTGKFEDASQIQELIEEQMSFTAILEK
ncbi:phosphate signaling complex protein PhoU [Mesoplasma seiffertii]|uniref:phosphate signaling complex protein PhoU n=1 Tax=Mesoplasma seiffertii TaxID=28224 RepID=UPI0006866EA0|nr:phosphate signaling complex protein PhoU [Mesoplasma seiffertii]